MHLHGCKLQARTIRPPHYHRRWLRRFWPWSWLRCPSSGQTSGPRSPPWRRSGRPPITNVKTWLECFACLAAVLVSLFPEKGPELWAYPTPQLRGGNMSHVWPSFPEGNYGLEGPQLFRP